MPRSIILSFVRRVRTFSLRESCGAHPYAWYASLCGVLVIWANYAQYRRLRPLYPDYDKYRNDEGGRMLTAKAQELAEVNRYNSMVSSMRHDLSSRS